MAIAGDESPIPLDMGPHYMDTPPTTTNDMWWPSPYPLVGYWSVQLPYASYWIAILVVKVNNGSWFFEIDWSAQQSQDKPFA